MVFASMRDDYLDMYTMDLLGKNLLRTPKTFGSDGSAWFNANAKKIIWRAIRPETDEEIIGHKEQLAERLITLTPFKMWISNADNTNSHQINNLSQAKLIPNFAPRKEKFIFCSNY